MKKRILLTMLIAGFIMTLFSIQLQSSPLKIDVGVYIHGSGHYHDYYEHGARRYRIKRKIRQNRQRIFKLRRKIDRLERKLEYRRMSRRKARRIQRRIYSYQDEIRYLKRRNRRLRRILYR